MGSAMFPIPGGYGNPTGVANGTNPNFNAETFNNLNNLTGNQQTTVPLGNNGRSTLNVPPPSVVASPVPTSAPTLAVTNPGQMARNPGGVSTYSPTPYTASYNPNSGPGPAPAVSSGNAGLDSMGQATVDMGHNYGHLTSDLEKVYGKGEGRSISNFVQNGSGFNPQVVKSLVDSIEPYFQENLNGILEDFAAGGQRFGSTAALAAGKYGAQFTSQEQQLMAQMYQWATQNYMNVITGGKGIPQSGSGIMGMIQTGMGIAGAAGAGLTAAGVGASGGAAAGIVSGLAAL